VSWKPVPGRPWIEEEPEEHQGRCLACGGYLAQGSPVLLARFSDRHQLCDARPMVQRMNELMTALVTHCRLAIAHHVANALEPLTDAAVVCFLHRGDVLYPHPLDPPDAWQSYCLADHAALESWVGEASPLDAAIFRALYDSLPPASGLAIFVAIDGHRAITRLPWESLDAMVLELRAERALERHLSAGTPRPAPGALS
jgi:hypothetical protein